MIYIYIHVHWKTCHHHVYVCIDSVFPFRSWPILVPTKSTSRGLGLKQKSTCSLARNDFNLFRCSAFRMAKNSTLLLMEEFLHDLECIKACNGTNYQPQPLAPSAAEQWCDRHHSNCRTESFFLWTDFWGERLCETGLQTYKTLGKWCKDRNLQKTL